MKLSLVLIAGLSLSAHVFAADAKKPEAKKEVKKEEATVKCDVVLEGTDMMSYQMNGAKATDINVPSGCKTFTVMLKHVGKLPKTAMGHNFVLTKAADADAINAEAMKQGPTKDYLVDMKKEPAKSKVIAMSSKLLSGGESENIKVEIEKHKMTKGGDYTFFCTFLGHYANMKGKFILN